MSVRRLKLQAMIIHAVYSGVDSLGKICELLRPISDPVDIANEVLALDVVWDILRLRPETCIDDLEDPDPWSVYTLKAWYNCRVELKANREAIENLLKNFFYRG